MNFFFVCDNRESPLYNWTKKPMSWDGSAKEWIHKSSGFDKEVFNLSVLHREIELHMPISDWWEDVEEEFIDFLTEYASSWQLRDSVFHIWKKILEHYKPVLVNGNWWAVVVFRKVGGQSFVDNNYILTEAKEMMDGYVNMNWVNGVSFCEDERSVMYEWVNFNIEWAYAPMLRELSFVNGEFFEKTLRDTGEGKYLQDFQVDVIKNMGKYTFFTVIRQVGKTLLLSWISLREIMKDNRKWKMSKVIFISNELDAWDQVKEYIQWLSLEFNERFGDTWGRFEYTAKKVSFTNGKSWKARKVYGEIQYFSAQGRNPGTGKSSDLIVGDEINLWPESVWDRNKKVIENRPTRFIGATTMYEDSDSDHWSNKMLKKGEQSVMQRWPINEWIINTYKKYFEGKKINDIPSETMLDVQLDNLYVWLRYSGDDVEIMNERQKQIKIESYKWNYDQFLVEWCWLYPDDIKVFTFDHVIKNIREDDIDNMIIAYDPSSANKKWDEWWFLRWYVKDKEFYTFEMPVLPPWDFESQSDLVIEFISQVTVKFMLIIDTSWFGGAIVGQKFDRLAEENPDVLPIENYIKLTTSWWSKTNRLGDVHYSCPLKIQVWFLKNALYNEKIIFSHKLEKLFSQMRKYKKKKTPKWEDTWNGWRWDDLVSALLMMVRYFYEVLWAKDDAFDEQSMKMIRRKEKTEEEISDEIAARKARERRMAWQLSNRVNWWDIY